jgi:hypothetical protein
MSCLFGDLRSNIILKVYFFWNITPCQPVNSYRSFEESYCLRLQGQVGLFDCSNFKIKALRTCQTGGIVYQSTRRNIPEEMKAFLLNNSICVDVNITLVKVLFNNTVYCYDYTASVVGGWVWKFYGMILTVQKSCTRRKPCLSAVSSTAKPTYSGLELNPDLFGEKPAININVMVVTGS